MEVRSFDWEKDYPLISSWWAAQDWPAIPKEALPKRGLTACVNGIPVCSGFIYRTDSSVALLEWIVGDPGVEWEIRDQALDALIQKALLICKELGFSSVFSSLRHGRLIDRYKRHGFNVTDEGMTNLVRGL